MKETTVSNEKLKRNIDSKFIFFIISVMGFFWSFLKKPALPCSRSLRLLLELDLTSLNSIVMTSVDFLKLVSVDVHSIWRQIREDWNFSRKFSSKQNFFIENLHTLKRHWAFCLSLTEILIGIQRGFRKSIDQLPSSNPHFLPKNYTNFVSICQILWWISGEFLRIHSHLLSDWPLSSRIAWIPYLNTSKLTGSFGRRLTNAKRLARCSLVPKTGWLNPIEIT